MTVYRYIFNLDEECKQLIDAVPRGKRSDFVRQRVLRKADEAKAAPNLTQNPIPTVRIRI